MAVGPAPSSVALAPLTYPDELILGILRTVRTIAMVGASPNWNRPSYFAMRYLQRKGYRVIPVNPRALGEEILGEQVYPDLKSIPFPVDVVDVFRRSESAGEFADQAVAVGAGGVWFQMGVMDEAAFRRATEAGMPMVMDVCPSQQWFYRERRGA